MKIDTDTRRVRRSISVACAMFGIAIVPCAVGVGVAEGSTLTLAAHQTLGATKYGTVNEVTISKLNKTNHTFVAKGEVISANDEHITKVTWKVEYGTYTVFGNAKASTLKNGEKFGEVAGPWIGSTLKATAIDK